MFLTRQIVRRRGNDLLLTPVYDLYFFCIFYCHSLWVHERHAGEGHIKAFYFMLSFVA